MTTTRRLAAGVCTLLAALTMLGAPPAAADEPHAHEPPKVELVLDVSGSMRAADIGGMTRMAAAQHAFDEVVDALPPETLLGIRVLGAGYPGNSKAIGCRDTQQLVPVGHVDRTQAKAAIATLRPTGWTPVGLALRAAARDLGTGDTTRRIVLITDGEDTCAPPDPCEVARELAAQGTHLVVDTLGLTLDDRVRRQLTCIAGATGGTYTAVQSEQQLSGRLTQLVHRADTTYRQTPAAVQGGDRCAGAPLLSPGVYTDRERFQEHRWYRVPVRPGEELRASVSISLDRQVDRDYGVLLRATDAHGQELTRGSDAGSDRSDVLSTGLRWSAERADGTTETAGTDASGAVTTVPAGDTVCLVVSNSLSAPPGVRRSPGMPVQLSVDVVPSSPGPGDPAFGLGRGWVLLLVLTLAGLLAGLVAGWLGRWRVSVWREN